MTKSAEPAAASVARTRLKITKVKDTSLMAIGRDVRGEDTLTAGQLVYQIPEPPPGVGKRNADGAVIAQDWSGDVSNVLNWAMAGAFHEGVMFPGYAYLAELTQRAEYRRPAEILANEMTRKGIKLTAKGKAKAAKIAILEGAMKRHKIMTLFRQAAEMDGFFGRAQIFVCHKEVVEGDDLTTPLVRDAQGRTIAKGDKIRFQLVEPMWVYPGGFNSNNPLHPHFYRPQDWWIMAQRVHTTRLLTIASRAVPDVLKPIYGFGGLSLSQMAKPYVDNWLRTRQSVSDLIHSFSTMVLGTDMSSLLTGGDASTLISRAQAFNRFRDNRGLMLIDKGEEELTNVSTPLGTLDHLQAQAQEHMASVNGIPLVVLLGITPSGLNASSDGEIRTFYGWIASQQEKVFADPLMVVIEFLQLVEFGEIDPDIGFEFLPLWEADEGEEATRRKTDADTDAVLISSGVILPEEARGRLAGDESSPYHGLDMTVEVEPPVPEGPPDGEDPPGDQDDEDEDKPTDG